MKNIKIILTSLVCLLIVISACIFGLQNSMYDLKKSENDVGTTSAEPGKKGIGGAMRYWAAMRNNQLTGTINIQDIHRGIDGIIQLPIVKDNTYWKFEGPDNVGGRTRAIVIDNRNPNIIYAGGVSGGLWKSTTGGTSWKKIQLKGATPESSFVNINISTLAQGPDGTIYAGTGEVFVNILDGTGDTGFIGNGIYKSTDGEYFELLTSTIPGTIAQKSANWAFIDRIAVNPVNGWVFVAADKTGLQMSTNNGSSWITLKSGTATDVEIGTDGTVVAVIDNKCYISKQFGDLGTFEIMTTGGTTGLPVPVSSDGKITYISRIRLAVAPSNSNYIYALVANASQELLGVYRSTDKGKTWSVIGPGGSSNFEIFVSAYGQGRYNNEIAVFPDDPDRILVAGVTLWEWKLGKTWIMKSDMRGYPIHVDMHRIVFHPANPKIYYIGTDGGMYRTMDKGETYQMINKNYNVTQFYAVASSGTGELMGGTQDNSTPYINGKGNTKEAAQILWGGDGGWSAFSLINPDAVFVTSQSGSNARNPKKTSEFSWQGPGDWFSGRYCAEGAKDCKAWGMLGEGPLGTNFPAPFITPLILWETFNDIYSQDYITFKTDSTQSYVKDQIITVPSKNNSFPFDYKLKRNLKKTDTVQIKDKIQTRYFVGFNKMIWMTKGALDFSGPPKWFKIAKIINGSTRTIALSKDGNCLYVGTTSGNIYRISNIRFGYDSLRADVRSKSCVIVTDLIHTFDGRIITSIAVDPQNSAHIIVTLGNYGNQVYIYESKDALNDSPSFQPKQGNFPLIPVYSSLIEMNDANLVYIGTEYGIYRTDNISAENPVWMQDNMGENVPVTMLRQHLFKYDGDYAPSGNPLKPYTYIANNLVNKNVTNYGIIYAATHGRGFFSTDKYKVNVGISELPKAISLKTILNVYPNPVKDIVNISYSLTNRSEVTIRIYNLSGILVRYIEQPSQAAGYNKLSLNIGDLPVGTYIINLKAGEQSSSGKIIVTK